MSGNPEWIHKLEDAVKKSICRSDVLRHLNLVTNGSGNHRIVQKWIDKLQIDTSHFDISKARGKNSGKNKQIPIDLILAEGTTLNSSTKKKLKTLLKYECHFCKNPGKHRELPLALQIDHINGIHTDNRLENLRWLCPNCHTQTPTYGSKKLKKELSIQEPHKASKSKDRPSTRKVVRPSKDELATLINSHSWVYLGRKFGVSDNAVRKWARRYKLIT
jgi:5-methylcytosine-specific restriction endonuclease McrA